jgi:hypothetical protein
VIDRALPGKHSAANEITRPRITSPYIKNKSTAFNKNKLESSPAIGVPATCETAMYNHLIDDEMENQCDPERISKWVVRIFTKQTLAKFK